MTGVQSCALPIYSDWSSNVCSSDLPCPGVREKVRHGVNAMIYPMGDSCELADQLRHLLDDPEICQAMGQASADMFCCLATYPEMLAEYERALLRATCSVS